MKTDLAMKKSRISLLKAIACRQAFDVLIVPTPLNLDQCLSPTRYFRVFNLRLSFV